MTATFVFYTFDPEQTAIFPQCPLLLTTGYACPGCGSQRAIHSVLHFDFKSAFMHNALILFLMPYVLLGFYLEVLEAKKRFVKLEQLFFGKWAAAVVISVILIYWVVRNLSF